MTSRATVIFLLLGTSLLGTSLLLGTALLLGATSCSHATSPVAGRSAPAGDANEVVLELDGMTFTRGEIAEFAPFYKAIQPQRGRNSIAQAVLTNHLLPMKLARRALTSERTVQLDHARLLARVVGNGGYPGLVAQGTAHDGFQPHPLPRPADLPLAISRWAFDEEHLGQVSPVLETPQGFALVATADIHRGITRLDDRAEVFIVPFYTHDGASFARWLQQAEAAVADKAARVHPDFRDAVPLWLKTEK